MSPDEVQRWVDMLISLLTVGGGGGIILAIIGYMKAKRERPDHIAKPTIGHDAMMQIGGMVLAPNHAQDLATGLRSVAAAHDKCTILRELEIEERKKLQKEHIEHEQKLLEERKRHEHRLEENTSDRHRQFVNVMNDLRDQLHNISGKMPRPEV